MSSLERWQFAQRYEQSYWQNVANRMASGVGGQLGWYGWRASQLEMRLAGALRDDQK